MLKAVFFLLLVFSVTLSSCRNDDTIISLGTSHPTVENIPSVSDSRFVLYERVVDAERDSLILDLDKSSARAIGVAEGPHHRMIGEIADVAASDDFLYYLDKQYGELRIYDYHGSFVNAVGEPGEGPSEFFTAGSMAFIVNGERVVVLDKGQRVRIFGITKSGFELLSSFQAEAPWLSDLDVCVINEYLYILGYSEESEGIIHKHSFEGELVDSFGSPYKSKNPLVKLLMSATGTLACNENHQIVAHARNNVPVLTGYSENGDEVWRVKFADFGLGWGMVEEVQDNGLPRVAYPPGSGGQSRGMKVVSDPFSDSFIVHYYTLGDSTRMMPEGRHVFRVKVPSGLGYYLGQIEGIRDGPEVIAFSAENIITSVRYPFPQIRIYERRLGMYE